MKFYQIFFLQRLRCYVVLLYSVNNVNYIYRLIFFNIKPNFYSWDKLYLDTMYSCVCVCLCVIDFFHILFIHSSINGHPAVNIEVHRFQDPGFIFFGSMSRIRIAGSYSDFIFNFLRNLIWFSIMALPIYIPTNRVFFVYVHWWMNR